MKSFLFAACAALALAACGQSETASDTAPAAPQSLMQQIQAQAADQQLVTAAIALQTYQRAHPEVTPPCTAIRATESRGVIPENMDPNTIYAAHKGALVISVQCGVLISRERMDPHEHWLVVYAPGATEPAFVNCAGEGDSDQCPRIIRTPAAAPSSATTP
jgi:hypothetical protein